jgi:hypothetical protein
MVQKSKQVSLHEFLSSNFKISRKRKFNDIEKKKLKPIAETLAMLDGNAFFGMSTDDNGNDIWYEQYLPEAYTIYIHNGSDNGWAGEASWIKQLKHENDSVKTAYQEWQLIKSLSTKRI